MRAVVVTGASTGIGRACAEHLAARGFYVFAGVRKPEDSAALDAALGERGRALTLDVRDVEALAAAADVVRAHLEGRALAGLVNNAGVALPGPALIQPMSEIEQVLDVNFLGVVRTCQAFGPLLSGGMETGGASRKWSPGRIVNITSVSGKFGYPFTAAYVASKHAVEGFSDSLRRELQLVGVDVIVVGPGAVKTPIWGKGAAVGRNRYDGTIWAGPLDKLTASLAAMDAEGLEAVEVARVVATALTAEKPRTRYAPVPNKLVNWWLARLLPPRVIDRIVGQRLGLTHR
jgi:NAD(P)-dependent dehydrogenase (short-subunit alcohol dehydrogenase family)